MDLQALAQARAAGQRFLAIKRLEAAGQQAGQCECGRQTGEAGDRRVGAHATTFTILCGTTMTFFGLLAFESPFYRIQGQDGSLDLGALWRRAARSRPPASYR